jgi:hypothetical protein
MKISAKSISSYVVTLALGFCGGFSFSPDRNAILYKSDVDSLSFDKNGYLNIFLDSTKVNEVKEKINKNYFLKSRPMADSASSKDGDK